MIGTNDVKKDKDRKALKNIRAMKPIINSNTTFIHIPPQHITKIDILNKQADNARKNLNEVYDMYFRTIKLEEMEKDPMKYLQKDGYHITEEAGEVIAEKIRQDVQGKREKKSDVTPMMIDDIPARQIRQNTQQNRVQVPKRFMGQVLGEKGDKMKTINKKNQTTTTNEKITELETTILIEGPTDKQTEATKKDITDTIEKWIHDETMRTKNTRTTCRYYKEGTCTYGDRCWYTHEQEEGDNSKRQTRAPTTDTHIINRNRSRSKHREDRYQQQGRTQSQDKQTRQDRIYYNSERSNRRVHYRDEREPTYRQRSYQQSSRTAPY